MMISDGLFAGPGLKANAEPTTPVSGLTNGASRNGVCEREKSFRLAALLV